MQLMYRGTQAWQGNWRPLPLCIPEGLHRYWRCTLKFCFFSYQLFSWKRSSCRLCATDVVCVIQKAVCVSLRSLCMCQWEIMWFFCNFRAIATISIPQYLKNFGYLCFTETIFSTCLFSLRNDGLGFDRLQQQQALPFQVFLSSFG